MSINIDSGKKITKHDAQNYTHAFQAKNPKATKAYFVGLEKLNLILKQDSCIGIRIYDGYNTKTDEENRILIGVNKAGEDMVEGIIIEELLPCPPHCPKASLLIEE